ncbi:hypothetical protein [Rhodovarius sp.]|jgi:hypothetical protein
MGDDQAFCHTMARQCGECGQLHAQCAIAILPRANGDSRECMMW